MEVQGHHDGTQRCLHPPPNLRDLQGVQAEHRVAEGAERGYQTVNAWERVPIRHIRRASAARAWPASVVVARR